MQKVKTNAELQKYLKAGKTQFEITAKGVFEINIPLLWISVSVSAKLSAEVLIKAWGSSRVEAWESSRVEAWGSSSVVARGSSRVEAWGSSSVVAWGSSSVVAWGSSSVVARESSSVVARGYVSLHLWGLAKAKLSAKCHVHIHSKKAKATGGKKTEAYIETGKDWCDYYGVEVKAGIAVVYKGLNEDFSSSRDNSFKYIPGTTPESKGWDTQECSYGLHFSPHPRMTLDFHVSAKKFVACPIFVKDMLIFMDGDYPAKCKTPKLAKPCWEVDIEGKKIT